MGLRDLFKGRGRALDDRDQRVRLAAVEAAEDDPLFAPGLVEERAARLFVAIQRAWSDDDIARLRTMVGPELMVEWEARLADFRRKGWRNPVDVLEGPEVRYVRVVNRAGDDEDVVVVHLTARLRDVAIDRYGEQLIGDEPDVSRISEYWTLGKRGAEWVVVSIEEEREGAHHLTDPVVAVPESDDRRLRADAVMEVAATDAIASEQVGQFLSPAFSGDARAAALDLSLVDGRFAPDVLATAVGEVVEAWSQAIDGADGPLEARTTPSALRDLLYPTASQRDRLVIRGLDVGETTIVSVLPGPPAEVGLELEAVGVQYVEDRDTTQVLAGDKRRRRTTRQHWTLRLTDDPRVPWVVVDARGVIPR